MRAPLVRSGALLLALVCGRGGIAHAEPPPSPSLSTPSPSAESLTSARQAWDAREFSAAELFYKNALDQGGLAPNEVLEAYVRLGAARAALNKASLSRAAFRQAAAIDVHFKVPKEAGKRAQQVAAVARREEARVGSIVLRATMPQHVPSGQSFPIDATIDGKHNATVARLGVDARDSLTGKRFTHSEVAGTSTHFEVPATMTLPGATLVIRIDALDAHDNRLASREQRVQVDAAPPAAVAAAPAPTPAPAPGPAMAPTLTFREPGDAPSTPADKSKSSGGFWSSPWPYFIGGVALAGAGAAIYFGTRPSDDVNIGSAHVNSR